MKVKLKIERCKHLHAQPHRLKRYWVHLSTGQYFPIFWGPKGWTNLFVQHIHYPTPEKVIAASIKIVLAAVDNSEYRKMRNKEQVFTFDDEKVSSIKLPKAA